MISRNEVDYLLLQMKRAAGYCANARPVSRRPDREELLAEPTEFYAGASGYAGATLRYVIDAIESNL